MASFPVLFGQPGFGNEDRDSWLRALTMFLSDPFRPIGGRYGYNVPANAITGVLDPSQIPGGGDIYNNFGIRELNSFPAATVLNLGDIVAVSDRPGLLFVFGEPNNNFAMFSLGVDKSGAPPWSGNVQLLVSADAADFSTVTGGTGTLNAFFDGADNQWKIENNFASATEFYMVIMSLGSQL